MRKFFKGFGYSQQAKNGSGYPLPMLAKKEKIPNRIAGKNKNDNAIVFLAFLTKRKNEYGVKRKNTRLNISPIG